MTRRSAAPLYAAISVVVLLATGCTGSSGSRTTTPASSTASSTSPALACSQVSLDLVTAVQQYVDAYGSPVTGSSKTTTSDPDGKKLQAAVRNAQTSLQNNGCDIAEFRSRFDKGLSGIKTRGPLAKAVLLRLTASITGTAKQAAATVSLTPKDDLPRRLAELASGSTVRLAAGTYRLTESLVLLEGVTIRGAGQGRTTLQTTAADTGILVLTDGRVELRELTLSHTGKALADVLVGGPTSSVVLTKMRLTGGRGSSATGGNGVLMTSNGQGRNRGTTLEVTASTFDHNSAAGILLTDGHIASIRQARFEANDSCGVCFSGVSTGAVRNSVFVGNRVGAAILDQAKPALVSDTFEGGLFGIQASNKSTPVVESATVSGASRAAMIFADESAGRVDKSTCTKVPYGIVVSPRALPLLGDNNCELAKGK